MYNGCTVTEGIYNSLLYEGVVIWNKYLEDEHFTDYWNICELMCMNPRQKHAVKLQL